ncbi:MAG: gamma-glutamyl-gamma-aminobutyrate hydrolase family protein [Alphaproteobacteria bacterium]
MTQSRPTLRVALTMRVADATGYRESRDSISHDWLARLSDWNMTPVLVPNVLTEPGTYLDGLKADLLVLTGGDDPGAAPKRDATESRLLDHALGRNLPVLGVCRGMQLINLHFGGSLGQLEGHVARPHGVTVEPTWLGVYDAETTVNSFHDQGIPPGGLASGLAAAAFDPDGNVEALHHHSLPVAAVMWHPEREKPLAGDRRLMRKLAKYGAFWA